MSTDSGMLPGVFELERSDFAREAPDAHHHSPRPPSLRLPSTCGDFTVVLAQAAPRVHCESDVGPAPLLEGLEEVATVKPLHLGC